MSELTREQRIHKMRLMAKDYPVRITTAGGKFLIRVVTFEKDQYGMPINHRDTYARFETLADAVECGIRWREKKYE